VLSERELVEIIRRKLERGEYTPEQLQAIEIGLKLYERGFNVIPVNSEGRPVATLLGVDTTKRLPRERLLEGLIDVGFRGVATNNGNLPGNPGKLLYVVRARQDALAKCKALDELVNSTASWRREGHVEALVVVDREVASRLLSKPIALGDIEIKPPGLLVVAGARAEPIRGFDFNSPTLGIKEVSEELAGLLREIGGFKRRGGLYAGYKR